MADRDADASVRHLLAVPDDDAFRPDPAVGARSWAGARGGLAIDPFGPQFAAEVVPVAAVGDDPGWQAVALVLRATGRLVRRATDDPSPDTDEAAVGDLARAEALLPTIPATSWLLGCVRSALASAYHLMGLYELALTHLTAPASWSGRQGRTPVHRWSHAVELAGLHLDWADDLARSGVEGAEDHRADAARHAREALAVAAGAHEPVGAVGHPSTAAHLSPRHRDRAELLLVCATVDDTHDPDGPEDPGGREPVERDPGATADRMEALLDAVGSGPTSDLPCQVLPYLARAQLRAGRTAAAWATAQRAVTDAGRNWVSELQARRVLLEVLVVQQQPGAAEGLAYGRLLSAELWRRRARRLREARTLLDLESLRDEHERVARLSVEDPLTGPANRRPPAAPGAEGAETDAMDALA